MNAAVPARLAALDEDPDISVAYLVALPATTRAGLSVNRQLTLNHCLCRFISSICVAWDLLQIDHNVTTRRTLHRLNLSAFFFLASRCLLAITHQQRTRSWCAADLFRRSTSELAKVLLELFKTHRCEFLAFVWLGHRPAPFRVPSNRPAATTDIAIAPSATAQSRIMIRWSLFMIAPPSGSFSSLRFD